MAGKRLRAGCSTAWIGSTETGSEAKDQVGHADGGFKFQAAKKIPCWGLVLNLLLILPALAPPATKKSCRSAALQAFGSGGGTRGSPRGWGALELTVAHFP